MEGMEGMEGTEGTEERGGEGLEDGGGWEAGLATAAWLDQADLVPAAFLRGRIFDTSAGKSSSWKEEDFLGCAE